MSELSAGFAFVTTSQLHPLMEWQVDLIEGKVVVGGHTFLRGALVCHRLLFDGRLETTNGPQFSLKPRHQASSCQERIFSASETRASRTVGLSKERMASSTSSGFIP